ncbi:AmmeMemoRadiSam system radical SAM enzyme [Propionibacterium sp.]|uniref:AmmeMemoRadiSam system radical SAM enzyme n=1 Tax=Propionibacterium sp. TaxID=1977903 RepID=UPI0039EC4E88
MIRNPVDLTDGGGTDSAPPANALPARWWHRLPDGRLRCDLCPRACSLRDGQRGFCFVRARRGDQLWLDVAGPVSGLGIDPIEKKPLNHVLPGTRVLSFGTVGCNLGCRFCQNWQISTASSMVALQVEASPEHIVQTALREGCQAIAFTYNDPIIFAEYAIEVAHAAHEAGLLSIAVTAGYLNPEPRAEFFGCMDAANIDLKAFSDAFYRRITGARLQVVLDTISSVVASGRTWVELTTLLIPGHNDSDHELTAMCRWISAELGTEVPLHFSAFHPSHRMRDVPSTSPAALERARDIALAEGLHFVYTGNVHDPQGQSTWCPACGQTLIERDRYAIGTKHIDENNLCTRCGYRLPGIFQR